MAQSGTDATFGMLKDVNEARVRDVLSQMATDGYLFIAEGVCRLSCLARVLLKPPRRISIMKSNVWSVSRLR